MFSMVTIVRAVCLIFLQIHYLCGQSISTNTTLTIRNNCNQTIWPGVISFTDTVSDADSVFPLLKNQARAVSVQSNWRGQVWGRTLCSVDEQTGNFSCQTGDCATDKIQCGSLFAHPVTLAEFEFDEIDGDYYDVSVVYGYNLPLMVSPNVDNGGPGCNVTGCVFDLQGSCSIKLTLLGKAPNNGTLIGCRNPCSYTSDCQGSNISSIFKRSCPLAFTLPESEDPLTFKCASSVSSYNLTFCPSRLLSIPFSQALQPGTASTPGNITKKKLPKAQKLVGNITKKKLHKALIIAFSTIVVILLLMLLGFVIRARRRKAMEKTQAQTDEMRKFADSLQIDFNTIRVATRNFAADKKLGEGGFGEVYRGELEGGQEIAVKRLSKTSVQGIAEFETEIVLVAKLQHKNLVKLIGYCAAPKESLLIYEFLPNSSLDKFLFDPAKKPSLDWQTRFRIINGIARGLMYLHEDSRIKVVHRDLKSSNILLDEAMNPKIADFGLARLFEVDQTQGDTRRIVGTYGYMAPEYAMTGHYSAKSDAYSFGVIVLEIISGQRNKFFGRLQLDEALLHRAWRLWNEGEALNLIDRELGDDFERKEVLMCIQIGLLCIQENAIDRPRTTSIVAALNGQAISLPVPKPPHFFGYADGEARDMVDECVAPCVFTGAETITQVYSRD